MYPRFALEGQRLDSFTAAEFEVLSTTIPVWWVKRLWHHYNCFAIALYLHVHASDEQGYTICSISAISRACEDMRHDHVRIALRHLEDRGVLTRGSRAPGFDGANSYRLLYDRPLCFEDDVIENVVPGD